jgi:leader peptidase (prepilin peptidase)/N-methyltransferase
MLETIPNLIRIPFLVVLGSLVGVAVNWAIYSWTYFLKRPISPWMKRSPEASAPRWIDRLPVVGWWFLRRDQPVHGNAFWIRPLLIEVAWTIGLPMFYMWQSGGGLTGGPLVPPPADWPVWTETWFWGHTALFALMFIATFIDFDERTIPDSITIPGTLVALALAACCPWFRLPEVAGGLAGPTVDSIHFASTWKLPVWHRDWIGLAITLVVWTIWIIALLPKISTLRYGLWRGWRLMVASIVRPRRKRACEFRNRQRQPFGISLVLALIWLIGLGLLIAAKLRLPDIHWDALFGAMFGLAFGGGMVWSVRIVALFALEREAMGFGDVTLMAMIGAFLGWQAALLTFAIAPFAALLIVVTYFVITKDNELAFGPYLCFACLMLIFGWHTIWNIARFQIFFMGPYLFLLLFAALVLMPLLLIGLQWLKGPLVVEDESA